MEILRVENLTKSYGKNETKVDAIKNVSLSVEKGTFIAITGPSGSGKSTLLHLLGGVDRPTSGKVYINDVDIYNLKTKDLAIFRRRNIGLIYEFLLSKLPVGSSANIIEGLLINARPIEVLCCWPPDNLDSKNSKEILELLKLSVKKYNQTLIMITHDKNMALQADRIISIEDGIIKSDEVM